MQCTGTTWKLLALLLAGGVGSASAQHLATTPDSIPVTSLANVYRALQASPRIRAADARADAAEARIAPASRPPDPQLQLGFMNRNLPGLGLSDPLGMTQLQLMQMIPFPGKLGIASRVARAQSEVQRARATDVRWDVRARAAMAYYEIAMLDRSLVVAAETQRLVRNLAETSRSMYGVGAGQQADVLRAQVEIGRMDEEVVRMRVERESAVARLNALLDRDATTPVGATAFPVFPESLPPLPTMIEEAQASRPMVTAGEAEVRAATLSVRLARREIWPDLQVGVQYGQRPMDDGTERMASLMLGVNLPVFARSRQFAMRREAEAMHRMATADLAEMRADTRGRVGQLYAAVERSRRLLTLYRMTIIPQSDAATASAMSAYRVGGIDFMTLLDNQMTTNRYRQATYVLEAEHGQALAELEMLLGRTLFDSAITATNRGSP